VDRTKRGSNAERLPLGAPEPDGWPTNIHRRSYRDLFLGDAGRFGVSARCDLRPNAAKDSRIAGHTKAVVEDLREAEGTAERAISTKEIRKREKPGKQPRRRESATLAAASEPRTLRRPSPRTGHDPWPGLREQIKHHRSEVAKPARTPFVNRRTGIGPVIGRRFETHQNTRTSRTNSSHWWADLSVALSSALSGDQGVDRLRFLSNSG